MALLSKNYHSSITFNSINPLTLRLWDQYSNARTAEKVAALEAPSAYHSMVSTIERQKSLRIKVAGSLTHSRSNDYSYTIKPESHKQTASYAAGAWLL
jgi:hypothetical protein